MSNENPEQFEAEHATPSQWREFLKHEYRAVFSEDMATLMSHATVELYREREKGAQINVLVSRHFYKPLLARESPLKGLHLKTDLEVGNGLDEACREEFPPKDAPQWGAVYPSTAVLAALKRAVGLSRSAEVSPSHFAIALLSVDAPSFIALLGQNGFSAKQAKEILIHNIRENESELFENTPWENILDIAPPPLRESDIFIHQKQAIDAMDLQWENLWKNYTISSGLLEAFRSELALRKEQIKNVVKSTNSVEITKIPMLATKEAALLSILDYAKKVEVTTDMATNVNATFPYILGISINGTLELGAEQIRSSLIRTINNSTPPSDNTGKINAISKNLELVFNRAKKLATKISKGVIEERHFIAAYLLQLHASRETNKLEKESIPLSVLIFCLRKHIDQHLQPGVDLRDEWTVILDEIENQSKAAQTRSKPDSDTTEIDGGSSAPPEGENEAPQEGVSGTGTDFRRNSRPEELGGSTEDYASAVADAFKQSNNDDFCFALFGPWGSGKTTLMDLVADQLKDKFTTIKFNAWRYPTRPEIWVSLYETICEQAGGKSWWNRAKLALQTNLKKDNGFPLLIAGISMLFAAIPKGTLLESVFAVNKISGTITAVIIGSYALRLWNGAGQTLKTYLFLPSHKRHLGLQSVIGDDLKHLLQTWTEPTLEKFGDRIKKQWVYSAACISIILSLIVIQCRFFGDFSITIKLLFPLLTIASAVVLYKLLDPVDKTEKVLLVVDDLDRCPAEEILPVIESLRVLLDDNDEIDISKYLKIAMLIDRRILGHAIAQKYKRLVDIEDSSFEEKAAILPFCPEQLTLEQIEKLFLLTFEIPPLSKDELISIAEKITDFEATTEDSDTDDSKDEDIAKNREGENRRAPSHKKQENAEKEELSGNDDQAALAKANEQSSNQADVTDKVLNASDNETANETTKTEAAQFTLSKGEKELLVETFKQLHQSEGDALTPRRMRMLTMRFYLARDLCKRLGCEVHPKEIIDLLQSGDLSQTTDENLKHIIKMVQIAPLVEKTNTQSKDSKP